MFVGNLINVLVSFLFASVPSGSYSGSKTVFGETIGAVVTFQDSQKLDFGVSGAFTLDCAGESYSMNGNTIVLTNIGVAGDCAHDALVDNGVELTGIVYNPTSNQITVSVKYSIAKIDVLLSAVNIA
jgi:hypothetical protein